MQFLKKSDKIEEMSKVQEYHKITRTFESIFKIQSLKLKTQSKV